MKEINDKNFKDEVLEYDGVVLVDFSADWCGPCRMMKPVLKDISANSDIKVVEVDIDKNQATPAKYGVSSIPNMVVFKNGKMVDQMIGAKPKKALEAQLAKVS